MTFIRRIKMKRLLLSLLLVLALAVPARAMGTVTITSSAVTVQGNVWRKVITLSWVADAAAVDTTNKGNLNCPYNNGAAQTIRITPDQTPADNSGRVRVTIWYEDSIPPTS